jgi:predicted RNase H-like HicB family nuclease
MPGYANGTNYSDDELLEASHYPVIVEWSDEDQLFLAKLPDLGGLIVHGSTPEEALHKSARSAAQYLAAICQLGEAVPEPTSLLVGR